MTCFFGALNCKPPPLKIKQINQPSRTVHKFKKSIPNYTKSVHYSCWVDVYTGGGSVQGNGGWVTKGDPWTGPWLQNGGTATKAASPAPIRATGDSKIPPHQHNQTPAHCTQTQEEHSMQETSVHYSACWVDVYTGGGVCTGK